MVGSYCCELWLNDFVDAVIVYYNFYYKQKINEVQYLLINLFLSIIIEEICAIKELSEKYNGQRSTLRISTIGRLGTNVKRKINDKKNATFKIISSFASKKDDHFI